MPVCHPTRHKGKTSAARFVADKRKDVQNVRALCLFTISQERHRWLIQDKERRGDAFVYLSPDWPIDFAAEHAEYHNILIQPLRWFLEMHVTWRRILFSVQVQYLLNY